MKRRDFIRHLLKNDCIFLREGAKHSVFFNPLMKKSSTVPQFFSKENLPRPWGGITRKKINKGNYIAKKSSKRRFFGRINT